MTLVNQRRWQLEPTEDTTSSGSSTFWWAPAGSSVAPRNRRRRLDERRVIFTLVGAWGSMLGTREEQAALLRQFEEVTTDATSWGVYESAMEGLQGVVAVTRRRPELFRTIVDISAGSLLRRKPRFAFLEQTGPHDDE